MRVPSIPYLTREEVEREKERNKGRSSIARRISRNGRLCFFRLETFFSEVKWKHSPFNGQTFHVKFFRFREVPLDV